MRVHQNAWGRVSRVQKWVWKQNDDIPNFWLIWLIGMDAGRSADEPWQIVCACAMVFLPK